MKKAVDAGYFHLFRFNPALREQGKNPFHLDSREPCLDYETFLDGEIRYDALRQSSPEQAEKLFAEAAAAAAEELRQYLADNKQLVRDFVERELPAICVVPSHATYLLWLDCGYVTDNATELVHFIREYSGLYLTEGEEYGKPGKKFIRLNTACPRARLEEGLNRLRDSVRAYAEKR